MTTAQYQAILKHGETLQAIFPKTRGMDPIRLCKQLRRAETKAHAGATAYCNGEISMEQWEALTSQVLAKLDNLLGFKAAGVPVFVNGDCRGYALKVDDEWMRDADVVRRDGKVEYIGTKAVEYMLHAHPYSIHHAMKYEGYTFDKANPLYRDLGGYGIIAPEFGRDER